MSIDRISSYGGLYNQYGVSGIRQVSVEDVKKQDEQLAKQQMQQEIEPAKMDRAYEAFVKAPKTAKLEDISLNFNINETYDYIGRDADLQKLDMMSVISDMKKDKVLEQYQYFVGTGQIADPVVARTMDGMVIQK